MDDVVDTSGLPTGGGATDEAIPTPPQHPVANPGPQHQYGAVTIYCLGDPRPAVDGHRMIEQRLWEFRASLRDPDSTVELDLVNGTTVVIPVRAIAHVHITMERQAM